MGGVFSLSNLEKAFLQVHRDGTGPSRTNGPIIDFTNWRHLSGSTREKNLIRNIELISSKTAPHAQGSFSPGQG